MVKVFAPNGSAELGAADFISLAGATFVSLDSMSVGNIIMKESSALNSSHYGMPLLLTFSLSFSYFLSICLSVCYNLYLCLSF